MIKVTIEMLPLGFEESKRTIGELIIYNDATGSATQGNYKVTLMKSPGIAKRKGVWKRGTVKGFARKRLGPYDLLYLALKDCVGDRNGN